MAPKTTINHQMNFDVFATDSVSTFFGFISLILYFFVKDNKKRTCTRCTRILKCMPQEQHDCYSSPPLLWYVSEHPCGIAWPREGPPRVFAAVQQSSTRNLRASSSPRLAVPWVSPTYHLLQHSHQSLYDIFLIWWLEWLLSYRCALPLTLAAVSPGKQPDTKHCKLERKFVFSTELLAERG